MSITQEQLFELCCKKSPVAQKQLYDLYAPKLYGIALRYAHSKAMAEDILHDSFIKILENITKLNNPSALYSWMRSITVNTAVNAVTRNHFHPVDDSSLNYPDSSENSPLEQFSNQEILDAIQSLPDELRIIFNLSEIEGYTFNEISKMRNFSMSQVNRRIRAARALLREKLTNNQDGK